MIYPFPSFASHAAQTDWGGVSHPLGIDEMLSVAAEQLAAFLGPPRGRHG